MTNKHTYNRIAVVLVTVMLMIIAFAIPMRTASAESTTQVPATYKNFFDNTTIDIVAVGQDSKPALAYVNLTPVYDTTDTQYQGIDLAATFADIEELNDTWTKADIYINFKTELNISGVYSFRYTDVASESESKYSPTAIVTITGGYSMTANYDSVNDLFKFQLGKGESLKVIKLTFNSYKSSFASILAPVIGHEGSGDDNNQSGTTQPGNDGNDQTPTPQVPDIDWKKIGLSTFEIVLVNSWLIIFVIFILLLVFITKKRK